jgi:hypothetical protein
MLYFSFENLKHKLYQKNVKNQIGNSISNN